MAKTVSNLRDSVAGILTGLNLDNVKNLNTSFERSARELSQVISIPNTTGVSQVTLYDGVVDYVAPTDGSDSSFIDFRPQGMSRNINDYAYHDTLANFDRTKEWVSNGYHLSYEYVKGVKRLRIVSNVPVPKIELDPMTDDTGWTAGGSAGSLVDDETVFWVRPASLRFTLTGASTGTLTKTISGQDLTDYVGVGVVFLAIRTPSATDLTSISIKLGSDASNYYSVTSTTGFLGAWTANEWLLVALDLSTASTTGTPTVTAIDYCQISIVHGATLTNFYLGGLWVSLPSPHNLIYATNALFQASGFNPSITIASTADTVLLNDDAYVIYEHWCAGNIAKQQGGVLAGGLLAQTNEVLWGFPGRVSGLIPLYRARNPIQDTPQIGNWLDD